jgi:hypothetical protein
VRIDIHDVCRTLTISNSSVITVRSKHGVASVITARFDWNRRLKNSNDGYCAERCFCVSVTETVCPRTENIP